MGRAAAYAMVKKLNKKMEGALTSHTPAHNFTTTVAPFRAWRGLQRTVVEGPASATVTTGTKRAQRKSD